jgi:hypothetical protein
VSCGRSAMAAEVERRVWTRQTATSPRCSVDPDTDPRHIGSVAGRSVLPSIDDPGEPGS